MASVWTRPDDRHLSVWRHSDTDKESSLTPAATMPVFSRSSAGFVDDQEIFFLSSCANTIDSITFLKM
jgi:hypothetical protein